MKAGWSNPVSHSVSSSSAVSSAALTNPSAAISSLSPVWSSTALRRENLLAALMAEAVAMAALTVAATAAEVDSAAEAVAIVVVDLAAAVAVAAAGTNKITGTYRYYI